MQIPKHFLMLLLISACPAILALDANNSAIPIWPNGAPGSEGHSGEEEQVEAGAYVHNVHRPSLTVSLPDAVRANGAAIVIIPGGGHRMLVFENEGMVPARALNRYGITSFVLKYRLAREAGSTYTIEGDAASDARRAIRWVRAHSKDYGLDPRRIGVMGFSAGGELVSLVADNPTPTVLPATDAIDRISSRPDFQVLIYPGPLGTPGRSVVGAPPAFIAAGTLDHCCAPPALALYTQLRDAGVPAELHMFASTDHGFNLAMHNDRISIQHWPDRLADWLSDEGWLSSRR
ncbi:alpha/beta hydrolase [Sphingomonas sp. PAMC 26617]|uniref:alpha/beta hydrolase n=1 Tax=Sphingomonas sp. PAMC 26617 TaxID=1112216 RepID=UPI0004965BD9|nr:alpha/beta hydrolase [Sphingomonas sp. PAMC 26617]